MKIDSQTKPSRTGRFGLFINPIPFIPFPLLRGRGISSIREASPPFDPPLKQRGKKF